MKKKGDHEMSKKGKYLGKNEEQKNQESRLSYLELQCSLYNWTWGRFARLGISDNKKERQA